MTAKPLTMNPNYLAMVRGARELHQLLAAGKDDSTEADAIRDATDGPWQALSEVERNRIRNLSEDLYSLVEPPPAAQPMNQEAQAKLNEAYEAKQRGEWDKALDLLRRWRAHIDPGLVSYLRGFIWLEAGDPATAVLFFEHAYKFQPENETYFTNFLYTLSLTDATKARTHADEILKEYTKFTPAVVSRATDIKLHWARSMSETEGHLVFERLEPILKNTLARFEEQDPKNLDSSSYVETLALLGFGYEFVGNMQAAVEFYSRGLQFDPEHDALLVARGILLYGKSLRSIADFEMAIRTSSTLVWPYIFLAHHNLVNRRFEESLNFCEKVLLMQQGSPAVMSEVSEWVAIAQAGLGFPADMVLTSFEKAIRLDPSNDRAKRNLLAFESAYKPITIQKLEIRTEGALRISGLAERRFAMAA